MDEHSYDDIINLPNPTSKKHPRMSLHDRAAQFAPFAALTGHDAAIKETARLTDERLELSDEVIMRLNDQLNMIRDNIGTEQEVSITYAMPSEGRFHAEYDSERSYSKEELAQMFASVEWQADTMGASLLMPRRIIENALAKYNQSNPIKVYGDNTITSKDKAVIRRMAAYIGVSYTALVIRLRDMGLFEYHSILEYISNELNLGGVSQ